MGRRGLPGPIRVAYEENQLVPAEDYAVLEVGASPAKSREAAIVAVSLGFVAMAIQCVYSLVCATRASRTEAELVA